MATADEDLGLLYLQRSHEESTSYFVLLNQLEKDEEELMKRMLSNIWVCSSCETSIVTKVPAVAEVSLVVRGPRPPQCPLNENASMNLATM